MRHFILFIAVATMLSCGQNETNQKELELKEKELTLKEKELNLREKDPANIVSTKVDTVKKNSTPEVKTKDEKWQEFFTEFKIAVGNKDKAKIISLTKNFDDGGGGYTLKQWIDNDLNTAKKDLNSGVTYLKHDDGTTDKTVKVTQSGLCFEFKNGDWNFCGFLGD